MLLSGAGTRAGAGPKLELLHNTAADSKKLSFFVFLAIVCKTNLCMLTPRKLNWDEKFNSRIRKNIPTNCVTLPLSNVNERYARIFLFFS